MVGNQSAHRMGYLSSHIDWIIKRILAKLFRWTAKPSSDFPPAQQWKLKTLIAIRIKFASMTNLCNCLPSLFCGSMHPIIQIRLLVLLYSTERIFYIVLPPLRFIIMWPICRRPCIILTLPRRRIGDNSSRSQRQESPGFGVHPSNLISVRYDELDGRWVENDSILSQYHRHPQSTGQPPVLSLLLLRAYVEGEINQTEHRFRTGYSFANWVSVLMFDW